MNALRCHLLLAGVAAFTAASAAAPAAPVQVVSPPPPPVSVPLAPAAKAPAPAANKFRMPPPIQRRSAAAMPVPPRFLQVRSRIDALFDQRNNPPPKPEERNNPFRAPGSYVPPEPAASPEGVVIPVAGGHDLALLQQALATLRVGGTVQRGKVMLISITAGPNKAGTFKVGDVIYVNLNSESVPLRIHEIARNGVTFRFNEAEITLKL